MPSSGKAFHLNLSCFYVYPAKRGAWQLSIRHHSNRFGTAMFVAQTEMWGLECHCLKGHLNQQYRCGPLLKRREIFQNSILKIFVHHSKLSAMSWKFNTWSSSITRPSKWLLMSLCRSFSSPWVTYLARDKCRCRFFAAIQMSLSLFR